MRILIIIIASIIGIYILSLISLFISGRKTDARAIGGFIPDCLVFFKNLIKDSDVPMPYKVMLFLLLGSLISPIDLIPDFIPVVGQLDDAVLIMLALRYIIKRIGKESAVKHWPGPEKSLLVLLKLSGLSSREVKQ